MRYKEIISLFIVLVLPSISMAGFSLSHSQHNEEIDREIRDKIHAINSQIIESIKANDCSAVLDYVFDEIKHQSGYQSKIKNMCALIAPIARSNKFDIFNEYHSVRKGLGEGFFAIPSETEDDFYISIEAKTNNVFVSLLSTQGRPQEVMLGLIYFLKGDKWKLHSFTAGVVRLGGKSALQWFREANGLYKKGFLIPVALRLKLISDCIRPAPFFIYKKENKIKKFSIKFHQEYNNKYKFPIQLWGIASKPLIHSVIPQFVKMRLLPMVWYVTSYSLNDHSALQKEARLMTPELIKMFPGIGYKASHIVFKAFSEAPSNPNKNYRNFGTVVELQ